MPSLLSSNETTESSFPSHAKNSSHSVLGRSRQPWPAVTIRYRPAQTCPPFSLHFPLSSSHSKQPHPSPSLKLDQHTQRQSLRCASSPPACHRRGPAIQQVAV